MNFRFLIPLIVAIFYAISIHEFAHAWTANRLGDPTAKHQGRITLNPLAHIDPMGLIFLFLIGFGWGKPVQVNPYAFRHPRRDDILVSLAGPVSNFLSAIAFAVLYRIDLHFVIVAQQTQSVSLLNLLSALHLILSFIVMININLGLFNLIPLYPLDGSHILRGLLPEDLSERYAAHSAQMAQLFMIVIFVDMFTGGHVFRFLIGAPAAYMFNLLIGT